MDATDQTNISVTVKNYGYKKGVSTACHSFFVKQDKRNKVEESESS